MEIGVTHQIAQAWLDLYEYVIRETAKNPSARGRAELMQRIIELLEDNSAKDA